MSVRSSLAAVAVVLGTVFVVGCAQMSSPTSPSSSASSAVLNGGVVNPTTPTSAAPSLTLPSATSGLKASALSRGVTDVTLANAGWTCIQPGNGFTLCAPPGLGIPPIPPAADEQPTYDLMVFTLDHQFVHHVKLLRPDLYHGEPCLGGDPWTFLDFLNYYECIIPVRA
jgi:hypothetical protein